MERNARLAITFILFVAVCGAIVMRHRIETPGDWEAIAARLQALKDKVERNPNDRESLDAIRTILNGQWGFGRMYACGVLNELGKKGRPAVPDLIRALNCRDRVVEREAARALGSVAIGDSRPVPALIAKLSDDSRDSAWFSADALGNIGVPALSAIPALQKAAQSPWESMRYSADRALQKLKDLPTEQRSNSTTSDDQDGPKDISSGETWIQQE